MKEIQTITPEKFAPYGTVIAFPEESKESFLIVEREENAPWRLAVFRYSNRDVSVIEAHLDSKETFEPVSGITVLIVAEKESPEDYQAFILDKPVCLGKGVWHQVLSLSEQAQVKITENLEVGAVYHHFEKPIKIQVG